MKEIVNAEMPLSVPISHGTKAGNWLFISGQVPADVITNNLCSGSIDQETELVLTRIKRIVEEAGGTMSDIVKTTVFLTDKRDFGGMNKVFAKFFPQNPPARSCIEVGLAANVSVEIEAIAYID